MGSIPQLSILKGPTRPLAPNYLHHLIQKVAQQAPAQPALIFEDGNQVNRTSYKELNERGNRAARCISRIINGEQLPRNADGDFIIAVCMQPSDRLVQILLSVWKCGCAFLPLEPSFPTARIEHILREAKPVLVIYEGERLEGFGTARAISLEEMDKQAEGIDSHDLQSSECLKHIKDDLAIVLYTSGSTGVPKGVRLPHKVILNRLQWQFKCMPFNKSETVCVFKTALTFVDSVAEIWGPLLNGLAILVVPKATTKDPEKLTALLDKYKIERLVLVPSLLRSLLMYQQLQKRNDSLHSIKTWICSGETLSPSLTNEFFKFFPAHEYRLCNFYGSTEVMGDVTFHIINAPSEFEQKIPIGIPVDNTIIYLLDKDFRPVKGGEVGELFVAGLNLSAGYVNGRDPDKFINNPLAIDPTFSKLYRTGDFARVELGVLQYEGRTDSQVKIRGHRVDLSEVEKAVSALDCIEKCVVLCYKPGEINQALLAFVTTKILLSENQIEAMLREKLTSYMVPQIILIETVPLLVNGKIDRQSLLKYYENTNNNDDCCFEAEIDYTGVQPEQLPAAKALFETVASVLNRSARSAISINANFYDIGGNSLNSIFTISSLNEKGYHISISDFIAAMDFGEILDRIQSGDQRLEMTTEVPLYRMEMLQHKHKQDVYNMITTSFYQKADLEYWLMPDIKESDYPDLLELIWDALIEKDMGFVVYSQESNKCIGVSLNFDAHDEPIVEVKSKLSIIFDFLEFVEGPIRDNELPAGKGSIFHAFMMGTHSTLTAKENVRVMQYMEQEVLKLAKQKRFKGILTTNTSPLTQQLGDSVYGYKTMNDYQVNQYVAPDNTKPFGMAPDSQRAIVHWKEL